MTNPHLPSDDAPISGFDPDSATSSPGAVLEPVALASRVGSVDTLRGVAVLGILAMNIIAFAYPSSAYMNPMLPALLPYVGEFEGLNRAAWWVCHMLFDTKMMTIFSMLFGAGLILMDRRAAGREENGLQKGRFAGVYYRRLGWLLFIGMLHAYLIWWGDILVAYALCGMLLYPLRGLRPRWLITIGVVLTLVAIPLCTGLGALMQYMQSEATKANEVLAAGGTLTPDQRGWLDGHNEMTKSESAEVLAENIAAYRGSYSDTFKATAKNAIMLQTMMFVLNTFWRGMGLMLIGMGLMKLGVFAAQCSRRFYVGLILAGYGIGFPLVWYGADRLIDSGFDMAGYFLVNSHFNYVGSIFVALGHVGIVMLACQAGVLDGLRNCLAAVGRMAFTNYLMQSVLCTVFFYGWGFGQFARLERAELYLVVAGVWAVQLAWSPLWLSRFRFGPAEWAWRSLTYWKVQPMRLSSRHGQD
ncbi:MAG: DUF418 domain-containing protein [Pyrinomonadaceae bacterium]|nr:DUF418 domain-containing protein [Phycisphaerales bacterium]